MSDKSILEMFCFDFNNKIDNIKSDLIGVSLSQVSDAQRFLKGMNFCMLSINVFDSTNYEYVEICITNLLHVSLDKLLENKGVVNE